METFFGTCDSATGILKQRGVILYSLPLFLIGFEQCLNEIRLSPGQHLAIGLRALSSEMVNLGFTLGFQVQLQPTLTFISVRFT